MFKRKKQAAAVQRPPPPLPPPPPSVVHRKSVAKLTVSECLQQAQGALQKLRDINPGDLQAFPLLNEIQRLVQQLKEATAPLPPSDREAWSFQIADLEDEFRELTDVVVSRADAAPKPEPRLSSPATYSSSAASSRTSKTQALLSPSNSGRVQQAVALFSRQDGFTNSSSQAAGLRRPQTTYQQQRIPQPTPQQQQAPQQQLQYPQQHSQQQQQQQQQYPQYPQQHHEHHQPIAEQPYPQQYPHAASSAASTPARSDSSFIYLTDEERELLAQKQQALLQKHFKYLAQQQREAEDQAAAPGARSAVVSAQQLDPAAMHQQQQLLYQQQQQQQQQLLHQQQQQLPQYPYQQAQVPLPAIYHEQQRRGTPSEYSSTQATPYATDSLQSPAWSATGVQGSTSGARALMAGGHAVGVAAAAPWAAGGGTAASAATAAAYGQQHQGPYSAAQAGLVPQQRPEEHDGVVGAGGDGDDLFSGLDIVATDEQQSLAQPPQEDAIMPEHAHAQQQHQQQQPSASRSVASAAAATGTGVQAGGSGVHGDAFQQAQRAPTHSFRPAGHSMPHRLYAGSQVGSRVDSAGPSQQPEALAAVQQADPMAGAPAQHAQQQQGFPHRTQYPQMLSEQGAQQLHVQPQEPQQQEPQQRQMSASAHGYHSQARPAVQAGSQAFNALASPPWRGIATGASKQLSPFSQAASDTVASGAGPAASTSAVSDVDSASYPIRKKTSHLKLGYGIEEAANSQGQQPAGVQPAEQTGLYGAAGGAGPNTTGAKEQQQPGQAIGYQQQQGALATQNAWALQQQQVHLQHPAGRAGPTFHHQQQPTQQQFGADADQSTSAQGRAAPGNLAQAPLYGTQHMQQLQQEQQQTQRQQYMQQQQYLGHADQQQTPDPRLVPGAEAAQYPQMHALEGAPQHAQQLLQQHQYPAPAAQQQHAPGTYAGPDADVGRYPTVRPHEAALQQVQQSQQTQHAQHQAYPAQHVQPPQQQLQQPYQQWQQDQHQAMHPQHAQLQQGQLEEQYQQQQAQQQQQQAPTQASPGPWSRPGAEDQAGRDAAVAQAVQPHMAPLLPPTPEEQARTQLLQQIADSASPAIGALGSRPGQPHTHVADSAVAAHWRISSSNSAAGSAAIATAAAAAAAAVDVGASTVRGGDVSAGGHTLTSPPLPAPAAAASVTTASAASAARPSPYISAFMLNAQSPAVMDRASALAGSSPPQPAASATEFVAPSPAIAKTAAAMPSTPMHAATPAPAGPQHLQRGSITDANPVASAPSPAPSLLLSSGGLRTRSRGLISGGGVAADPAASLPAVSSLPNLMDLEAFLNNITGSVDACRTAAEQRAREMVSALAAALSQAQKVEAGVQQQRRAVKAALAGVMASITQLEADQAAAVDGEDFDTAAALDEQLTQLSHRRTSMDEQVQLLADALQRAAALRLQVLGRQAEVWRMTGAYLSRLQNGQQQMAATLASQADREAQAAAMLHRAAQEALTQRRAALEERQAELESAGAEVAAQVAAATAPAEAERQRRASARDALQAEVESLRALLAAKEAALAAKEAAVAEAEAAVRQQAAAYDQDLARLEEARRQLEAEGAQVAGHEQALQDSERQAEARAAAVEEHQAQLRRQADALGAAAGAMREEAEALAARVAAEARSQEERERLLKADEKAREGLKGLERCISDLSADLSRLAEQRGRLAAERAAAQEGLAGLQRALPELEAAKRAAAANKDFREAARLSGELRALSAQADVAAAQLARVSGELSELAVVESGKVSELEDLRAMVHDAQRHAAEAHHRYLVFSLGLSRTALEEAVGSELYEEAGALQAEVAAEEAEVLALERTWGLARPPQAQAQAAAAGAAAAARRRTSLEAAAAAAAAAATFTGGQLAAQYSYTRQSVGSLSAQSSRSLSSQLPPAHQHLQAQAHGGAQAAGLKASLPSAGGGSAGVHPGAASPTASPAWQQPQAQPQAQAHYQQEQAVTAAAAAVQQQQQPSQVATSPLAYLPPPPVDAAPSPVASPVRQWPHMATGGPDHGGGLVTAPAAAPGVIGMAPAPAVINGPVHAQPISPPTDPRVAHPPVYVDAQVCATASNRASLEGAPQQPALPQPSPAYLIPPHATTGPAHGSVAGAAPGLLAEPSGRSLAAAVSSSSTLGAGPLAAEQGIAAVVAASTSANGAPAGQSAEQSAGQHDAREEPEPLLSGGDVRSTPVDSGATTPGSHAMAGPHGPAVDAAAAPAPAPAPSGPATTAGAPADAAGPGVVHQERRGEQQYGDQVGERAALQDNPLYSCQSSGSRGSASALAGGSAAAAAAGAAPEGAEQHSAQLRRDGHATPASTSPAESESGTGAAAQASAGRPAGYETDEPSAPLTGGLRGVIAAGNEPEGGSAGSDKPGAV